MRTLTPDIAYSPGFDDASRVWVYVASRPLSEAEVAALQEALNDFVQRWTAHNRVLKAVGEVFACRFIVLMVDETLAPASGCSIDHSVHFLEAMSYQLGVDLMDRMHFAWVEEERLYVAHRDEFARRVAQQHIRPDTLVVNTLVQTKRDLRERWLVPFGQSWHQRVV